MYNINILHDYYSAGASVRLTRGQPDSANIAMTYEYTVRWHCLVFRLRRAVPRPVNQGNQGSPNSNPHVAQPTRHVPSISKQLCYLPLPLPLRHTELLACGLFPSIMT